MAVFQRKRRKRKPKVCFYCSSKQELVDYKDLERLRKYLTDKGKILPRRVSGNCAKHQRQLTRAVKLARNMALLPYTLD